MAIPRSVKIKCLLCMSAFVTNFLVPLLFPQQPSLKHKDRNLGLVCCPAGQLFARARIDRSAYCPGEKVLITGHVSNQSSKQVTGTEVQLVQKTVYKAPHGKLRTVTTSITLLPSCIPTCKSNYLMLIKQ